MEIKINQAPIQTEEPNREPWKFIQEQIKRSKIKRYDWKAVYGQTLTKTILTYKMSGISADKTVHLMINHNTIIQLAKENPRLARDMCKKIKISVYARYGENNSALRLYAQLNNGRYKNGDN